ncbi:hypothetical protein BYT27DRAFT_7253126 [Phlegmacium glaucopus]|nr:hypothetical protein BYT27DRAFT_7253126 [Phlegmacium glaucopus]
MGNPSTAVDTWMQDDMEEERQNMNEGEPGPENTINDDAGCLAEDESETARFTQHGDLELTSVYVDIEELYNLAQLNDIKIAMEYVQALKVASLDDDNNRLDKEAVERLRNPPTSPADVNDPDLRLGLDLFLAAIKSTQENYNLTWRAVLRRHPDDTIPSYEQMKRRVAEITGVVPIVHDMCSNTCLAFTGPFKNDDRCSQCNEPRFDPIMKKGRQQFYTIPVGPQLQALWANVEGARKLDYRRRKTQEALDEIERNGGIDRYEDFIHGSMYLDAVKSGRIQDTDMILMLSIDGAQLYEHKASDCWIYIWILFDHPPELRYKQRQILPGGFIPGPNKPKLINSFLFPGLHHLSALQREGLRIWDAFQNKISPSKPFFAFGTADGPGMMYLNGLVGYHGKHGCHLYCSITGRRKPGGSHYYPALLKPHNYTIDGCDHPDVSYAALPACSPDLYIENLRYLMEVGNETQYKKHRLITGISKPSIFLGLQPQKSFPVPTCFGSDIMHLAALNIPDLLINLWRGTFDCDKKDDRATWDWATLQGCTWEEHGKQVVATTPYLLGSFDCPPRNPAEKISSGYKAWEFLLYLYGLGPALLLQILPQKYYQNFCKLVFGMRIVHQHHITVEALVKAHASFLEFACKFEVLYYQRLTERLHFVRPSIHGVTHLVPEVVQTGPPICSSQWTMERTIGSLGREICQPSNPYANLSQRGLLRSQTNALIALIPDLENSPPVIPRGAQDLGDGYILLRARDKLYRRIDVSEEVAFAGYLKDIHGIDVDEDWSPVLARWARLRLPNGQVARSAWKEKLKPLLKVRMARNVKIESQPSSETRFAEVLYYFRTLIHGVEKVLAMVVFYSLPHRDLLDLSYNTLLSCTPEMGRRVIDVKSIRSVVAMIPHHPFPGDTQKRYFVVEKPGLDVAWLGGSTEVAPEEE